MQVINKNHAVSSITKKKTWKRRKKGKRQESFYVNYHNQDKVRGGEGKVRRRQGRRGEGKKGFYKS